MVDGELVYNGLNQLALILIVFNGVQSALLIILIIRGL